MSRTKRSKQHGYFRPIQTKAVKTAEHYAAQELAEEGFHVPPRQSARGNPASRAIPDAWDDIKVSAYYETWKAPRQ